MRLSHCIGMVVLGAFTTGCATKPLPEDLLPLKLDTYEIVRKVRCEARDAVRAKVIQFAKDDGNNSLADALTKGDRQFEQLNQTDFKPETWIKILTYDGGVIGYDFNLDATIINNASAGIGFIRPFELGPLNFGISAGNDRKRRNYRVFRITDRVSVLALNEKNSYCNPVAFLEGTPYPINGKIGIAESINTFMNLYELNALQLGKESKAPELTDSIEFTTKFYSKSSPTLKYNQLQPQVRFADANASIDVSREDVHKVIVALTLPKEEEPSGSEKKAKRQTAGKASKTQKLGAPPQQIAPSQSLQNQPNIPSETLDRVQKMLDQQLYRESIQQDRDLIDRLRRATE